MNDNVSYGLIDEEDHLEYNINSGDLLNVTNGNHSDSILIVGVAKSLPTISRRYTLDLVIHRNNSIIIQELGLENRYLVIQYMFKDNSSSITTDEFQSELNENFSEFDFHFLNRNSLVQNFYNPTLTFGVIPSSIQFIKIESIFIIIVSFIGIFALLRNHFDKESGNIALILTRGYPKKKIFQNNVGFQILILLSSLIFTPLVLFSSFFFLYYYNISFFLQPFVMKIDIVSIVLFILVISVLYVGLTSLTEILFYNKISSKKNLHKYLKKE